MKIAIHKNPGGFSDRWISYCEEKGIPYKIVNCYDSDILSQLVDCDGLMWHWIHEDYRAALFARQLMLSLSKTKIKTYPDVNTCWHYDDKIGQKYLLESIQAPLAGTFIFYTKDDAFKWIDGTVFPKVFKLSKGAGSINVILVKTPRKARKLVTKAFSSGFSIYNEWARFKDRLWVLRREKKISALKGVVKGLGRFLIHNEYAKYFSRQKGYAYFQDFIPDNNFDTRLIVIGDRCFGVRRYNRKNDFRASGSGVPAYDKELFNTQSIKVAFDVAKKLKAQSLALDFVMEGEVPKIVEISYTFIMGPFYDKCQGFWDRQLNWHDKNVNPQNFIIEDFIQECSNSNQGLNSKSTN
ncbi:MAG: hypothetical protein JST17_14870 [Bacteroidetes bacterium]|nr:hypothetical protein [Bacteroidota bacterium]